MSRPLPPSAPCADTVARIEAYLDGSLPSLDCAAIDAHAASCPGCGPFVAGLRGAVGACRDLAAQPIPGAVRARAIEAVQRLLATRPSPAASAGRASTGEVTTPAAGEE